MNPKLGAKALEDLMGLSSKAIGMRMAKYKKSKMPAAVEVEISTEKPGEENEEMGALPKAGPAAPSGVEGAEGGAPTQFTEEDKQMLREMYSKMCG